MGEMERPGAEPLPRFRAEPHFQQYLPAAALPHWGQNGVGPPSSFANLASPQWTQLRAIPLSYPEPLKKNRHGSEKVCPHRGQGQNAWQMPATHPKSR
jgi:hypothetical protein